MSGTQRAGRRPAATLRAWATLGSLLASLALCWSLLSVSSAMAAGGWSTPATIGPSFSAESVSCVTASFCVAVGSGGQAATYGGSSWSALAVVDGANTLRSVSCPSTTFCAAVDHAGHAVIRNGNSWEAPVTIDGSTLLTGISCASSSFCVAVDETGHVITYNGSAWSAPALVDSGGFLTSVSCASSTSCAAVDDPGRVVTYNGSSWSAPSEIDNVGLSSVSCPSTSFCVAVDFGLHAVVFTSGSWGTPTSINTRSPGPADSAAFVSCISSTFCAEANGGYNKAAIFNGSSWGQLTTIESVNENGSNTLSAVSCVSTTFCVLVDQAGAASFYSGEAAASTNYTWSGSGSSSDWSEGANWLGGVAPTAGEAIGTLAFPSLTPPLTAGDCFGSSPLDACYRTDNDLSGLSVTQLQLDDADEYELTGEGVSLGSGGLSTTNYAGSGGLATISVPLALSAAQTWNISGSASGGDGVVITAPLSGATADLSINLSEAGTVSLGSAALATDSEVGDVTVSSVDNDHNETVGLTNATLNSTDGHSLTLHDLTFRPNAVTTGPLILEDTLAEVDASHFNATLNADTLSGTTLTAASVSLDATSSLIVPITGTGTQAGQDFSQLSANGPISLDGATLTISDEVVGGCPAVPLGQVDTLVSTTGTLNGTFGNAPNGSTITTSCLSADYTRQAGESFRINYHTSGEPQTVTATALEGPPSEPPPAKEKTPEEPPSSSGGGNSSNPPSSGSDTSAATGSSTGSSGSPAGASGPVTATVSRAQLVAALAHLIPSGKAATASALLKHGGLGLSFPAPEAGALAVQWYAAPRGALTARKTKPVLVAAGKATFAAPGTGTIKLTLTAQGKQLLRHGGKVRLTAKARFVPVGGVGVNFDSEFRVGR